MIWLVGLILVIIVGIAGTVYLTNAIGRFGLIQKTSGGRKWLSRLLSLALIVICYALFSCLLSVLDATVIILHVVFFFLVFELIFYIFKKVLGASPKIYWKGWLALLTAALCLFIGYYQCMHVWQTEYSLSSDKSVKNLCIAMLSDSHIGTTFDGEGFARYLDRIMLQEPDLILIPGDFVDDDTKRADMLTACEALGQTNTKYGVWFAYGNHDRGYFNGRDFSAEELAQALEKNHVHILEDEIAYAGDLCIVGRRDASSGPRAELKELLEGIEKDRYVMVLDHEPTDYEKESVTEADLVVSGHTHGGQLIPLGVIGEVFGGNDRTYGYEKRNGTEFIVTSGISDWAVHFKTGTRSEYVIITVNGGAESHIKSPPLN